MRQLIIARKDLNMSAGKLAAQCCHASMAFITSPLREQAEHLRPFHYGKDCVSYKRFMISIPEDVCAEWICGIFTKTICEAKNYNHLMKAVTMARELGLVEGKDFFLIKDNCLTELTPEEVDENGVGRTLTCVGFRPLDDDIAHLISKKFQLYK